MSWWSAGSADISWWSAGISWWSAGSPDISWWSADIFWWSAGSAAISWWSSDMSWWSADMSWWSAGCADISWWSVDLSGCSTAFRFGCDRESGAALPPLTSALDPCFSVCFSWLRSLNSQSWWSRVTWWHFSPGFLGSNIFSFHAFKIVQACSKSTKSHNSRSNAPIRCLALIMYHKRNV